MSGSDFPLRDARWRRVALEEVCEVILGQSPPGSTYNEIGNGIPFFQGKAEFGDLFPLARKWCTTPKKLARQGDVLISVRAPVGPTNLCSFDACIGRGLAALRPIDGLPSRYLLYALRATQDALASRATGSTFAAIDGRTLRRHQISLAPESERERIVVEIEKQLSRLDAGVAALKRIQVNLKRYRAAVLKAACEGRLVPTEAELARQEGRSYEHASVLLERIKAEKAKLATDPRRRSRRSAESSLPPDLPPLPKGWVWATLPWMGELNRGKSRHRPRDDVRLYGGRYPFVQTGDIRKSAGTVRENSQSYSEFGLQQSRLWPAGTLCITIAANIAETAILSYPACFPDSVVGFLPSSDLIAVRFLEFFIRVAKDDLRRFAPATAQKNINLTILRDLLIPVPPSAEQRRIVLEVERRISFADDLDRIVTANLQRADRLRQSVLAAAFAGREASDGTPGLCNDLSPIVGGRTRFGGGTRSE